MSFSAITTSNIRSTVNHLLKSAIGTATNLRTQHQLYTCRPVNPYTSESSSREQVSVIFEHFNSNSDLTQIYNGIKQDLSKSHPSDNSDRPKRIVAITRHFDDKGISISEIPEDMIGFTTAWNAKIYMTKASNIEIKNFVYLRYSSIEQPSSNESQHSYYFFDKKDGSLMMRKALITRGIGHKEHKMLNDDYAQN
ncbi:MAG: hypothetical protein HAW66_05320 [Shewanella sp.]|nr:hypothetical protein [Shewanella sp.]